MPEAKIFRIHNKTEQRAGNTQGPINQGQWIKSSNWKCVPKEILHVEVYIQINLIVPFKAEKRRSEGNKGIKPAAPASIPVDCGNSDFYNTNLAKHRLS